MAIWRLTCSIAHPSLGGTGVNVWHARTTADDDVSGPLQDHEDALEAFYSAITGVAAGGTEFHSPGEWIRVNPEPPVIAVTDGFTVVTGTSVPPLPPANCIVVGWGSVTPTRRGRGRTFVGPIGTSMLEGDGTVTAAALTTCRGAADSVLAHNAIAGDGALGVYSRTDNVIRDFTSRTVHDQFAVLRSRRD